MRRAIIFGSSAAAMLALAYLWPMFGALSAQWQCARRDVHRGSLLLRRTGGGRDGRHGATGAQGRLTLDPNQFVGPVKEAYKFAEKNPALLAQLHCYCGCDKADGHQNLLDCYRGTHALGVRNLHRRGVDGEADVGAGLAGRTDSRRDPQEFRARELKRDN